MAIFESRPIRRAAGPIRGRAIAVAVAGVIAAVIVAACGGSSNSSSTPATTEASNTSAGAVMIDGVSVAPSPALHAMLPAAIKTSGKVAVAEDPTEAPWGYFASPGSKQFTGAEYDLGQAIAAKLGIKFIVTEQLFTGIIPGILAGKYMVGLANMGDRKDRETGLDFVDYLLDGDGLMVAKGNPHNVTSLSGLCGQTIAITAGSTFLTYAQQQNKPTCGSKPYQILTFPSDAETFLAIKSGKAAATLTDIAEAAYVARTSDGGNAFQPVHDPKAPQGYAVAWIGMAVTKNQPQLAQAMLAAEQQLVKSGAEHTILAHYGLGFFAGTKPKLNACAVSDPAC